MTITQAKRERQVFAGRGSSCQKAPWREEAWWVCGTQGRPVYLECVDRNLKEAEAGEVGYRVIPSRPMKAMLGWPKMFVFILRAGSKITFLF